MVPTAANGQPAAIASYRGSAFGLGVLTATPEGIARITVLGGGPDLAAKFAFPQDWEGATGARSR
jgi:RNA polymerase sigma-70 factor, ECF subfamily